MQGDEISLQKALNMVQKNNRDYVALLFYASWCPFSRVFRPSFSILSSLHPSIPHFAIEESSVRPRFVFSFFVHGFSVHFFFAEITSIHSLHFAVYYQNMVFMVSLH